uniref:Putative kunitz-type serine protease inhibitor n=1 Tax=Amblyomma triste TaxID=251400 RepID=A0A023G9T8_AMBTT
MNFLSVVLVWCLNGMVSRDETGVVQAEEPNSRPQRTAANVCELPPNLKGNHNGILVVERRVYYRKNDNKCVMFLVKEKGDTSGNNFVNRKDCYEACIPKSPCLKPKKGKEKGTIKGYTYYPGSDTCAKTKYNKKAKFGHKYNRFNSSEECRKWCAPE